MCDRYKADIEGILKRSDLSTITTKQIRRALEEKTGTSLQSSKKEINKYIEEIFVNFQQQNERERSPPVVNKTVAKKPVVKKEETLPIKKLTTPSAIKKTVAKKKKPAKERKPTDWPILKVSPPLSNIILTDLCSRPQAVKKMWEYIRKHSLQLETDKRMINCDANFKELCDGADQINTFTLNKYTQKCFEVIPKDEQPKYKEIVAERERKLEQENSTN